MEKEKVVFTACQIVRLLYRESNKLAGDFKALLADKINFDERDEKDEKKTLWVYNFKDTFLNNGKLFWSYSKIDEPKGTVDIVILELVFDDKTLNKFGAVEPLLLSMKSECKSKWFTCDWATVYLEHEKSLLEKITQQKVNDGKVYDIFNKQGNILHLKAIIYPLLKITNDQEINNNIITPLFS